MKEQSALLGRIEERFGEKFDSLTKLIEKTSDANQEIVQLKQEREQLIKTFVENKGLSQQEKNDFIKALREKDEQIEEFEQALNEIEKALNE